MRQYRFKVLFSTIIALCCAIPTWAQNTTPPGVPDSVLHGIPIYDVIGTTETVTGDNVFDESTFMGTRIVVGENGKLVFAPGATVETAVHTAGGEIHVWNGGEIVMGESSSFTGFKTNVGGNSVMVISGDYERAYGDSEGTLTANGATINSNVDVSKFGTLNLNGATINNPNIPAKTNSYGEIEIPAYDGHIMNTGGKITATDSTINLGGGGWTNYYDAEAKLTGGSVNGNVMNGARGTLNATETTFTGLVSNNGAYGVDEFWESTAGSMSLVNSTVNGTLYSYYGNNDLYVNGTTVQKNDGDSSGYNGNAYISNKLHVGADGLDMSGGSVSFYNNEAYNANSGRLTTITLTLTDSIMDTMLGNYDELLKGNSFFLSDFITNSNFYWIDDKGASQSSLINYWNGFEFVFDLSELSQAERWEEIYAAYGIDLSDGTSFAYGIDYNFDNGSWETGHAYDVRFFIPMTDSSGDPDDPNATPEPATLLMFGLGLGVIPVARRFRKK